MPSARIAVRVTPRSGKDVIEAGAGGVLIVRVTAPPDDGKANAAVCRLVAAALGLPKTAVTVVRGHTARSKVLEAAGIADEDAVRILRG